MLRTSHSSSHDRAVQASNTSSARPLNGAGPRVPAESSACHPSLPLSGTSRVVRVTSVLEGVLELKLRTPIAECRVKQVIGTSPVLADFKVLRGPCWPAPRRVPAAGQVVGDDPGIPTQSPAGGRRFDRHLPRRTVVDRFGPPSRFRRPAHTSRSVGPTEVSSWARAMARRSTSGALGVGGWPSPVAIASLVLPRYDRLERVGMYQVQQGLTLNVGALRHEDFKEKLLEGPRSR